MFTLGRSSYTSSFMGSFSCLDTPCETTVCMHEYCLSCEKSHVMIETCVYLDNNQTARTTKLGVSNVASICNENKIAAIHEVDDTEALVLSINDPQGQLSVCDLSHLTSDENLLEPKKTETHQDFCLPTGWNAKKQKALAKSATFPLSLVADDSDLSIGGACDLPSTELENQCSSTKSNPTYERSISLPVLPKLISAMKGNRAQHGSPSNFKLHVKWAPDVYDPPCTLLSHTVKKNHHQLPKARKNYYNKHKTKSARGSNNDRRTANRSLTSYRTESFNARLQTVRNSRSVLKEYGKSSTEGAEYAVDNQDSKCGGNFLVEALAKVNISSVTEVT